MSKQHKMICDLISAFLYQFKNKYKCSYKYSKKKQTKTDL